MQNPHYESIPVEVIKRILRYKTRPQDIESEPEYLDQKPAANSDQVVQANPKG